MTRLTFTVRRSFRTWLAGLQHYVVEQGGNFTCDPFRSITDSAEYVKRNPIPR